MTEQSEPDPVVVDSARLFGPEAFLGPVRRLQTPAITLAYRQFGAGPAVVMIMGLGGTMRYWSLALLGRLARRFRVTIFDNRGVGYSTDDLAAEMTIELMGRDTAELITRLGLARPGVVGWSMGAQIALALAVDHPGVIGRLVTVAGDSGSANAIQPEPRVAAVFNAGMTPARLIDLLFPDRAAAAKRSYTAEALAGEPQIARRTVTRQLAAEAAFAASPHVYDALPRLGLPVLIVQGCQDVVTNPRNAEILAARIPNARLVRFEGAGHGLAFQKTDSFVSTITPFLTDQS